VLALRRRTFASPLLLWLGLVAKARVRATSRANVLYVPWSANDMIELPCRGSPSLAAGRSVQRGEVSDQVQSIEMEESGDTAEEAAFKELIAKVGGWMGERGVRPQGPAGWVGAAAAGDLSKFARSVGS
jgi:hypothetical protein